MKSTPAGILAALAFALLPFITTNQVFYGPVNAKFFFILLAIDILALVAASHVYKRREGIALRGRWLLGSLAFVTLVQFIAVAFGVFPERSLWSDIFWSSGVIFLVHIGALAWFLGELLVEKDWFVIRRTIAVSSGLFSLLLIIGTAGLGATGTFLWINLGETGLTFGNETYAGTYLLLAFIVTLTESFRTRQWGKWRIALLVSAILIALSPLLFTFGLLVGRTPISALADTPVSLLGLARASSAAMFLVLAFLIGHLLVRRFVPT